MKNTFFVLLFILIHCIPNNAQQIDSIYIKQVDSLVNVSYEFADKRDFNNASQAIETAEKIAVDKIGKESLSYAKTCHAQARLLVNFNQDKKEAEKLYLEAIRIRSKILGKDNIDYASSIYNLGSLYGQSNDFVNAEKLILEALSIYEKIDGKESKSYGSCIGNLGIVYFMIENYEKAENYYLESLRLSENFNGQNSVKYCGTFLNSYSI